jgi:uncharacterized protein
LRKGLRLAVLQPTSVCNLNCGYCYVPDRRKLGRMSDAVLRAAASFLFAREEKDRSVDRSVEFLWHAGEPLAAGIAFYERAFQIIADLAPTGVSVSHVMQTNGTLVSPAWCEFFRKHRISLGLSIDGPAELHDAYRRTWGGQGSHARAMRGLRLLREHRFNPSAICVLTKEALMRPDEIYDFFKGSGFTSIAFNVDEDEGANATSSLSHEGFDVVRRQYAAFMRRLWRRWRSDGGVIRVREFDHVLACIRNLQLDASFFREPDEVVPFGIITVNREGGISTFAPELASTASREFGDFVLGNVLTDTPDAVEDSHVFRRLAAEVLAGRDLCRQTCKYYPLCGAGFQSNRISERGSLRATETRTCKLHRQTLIDVILDELTAETDAQSELASVSA